MIAQYEYKNDSNAVNCVLKEVDGGWIKCTESTFIGNINKIRNIQAYYDEESGLYYENGMFYDAVTNQVISEEKRVTYSYADDLDSQIYNWQQSLLNDAWFNSEAPYNQSWYEKLSEVEIVARTIYGENTNNIVDQRAIAWTIRNRAVHGAITPRDVVTAQGQFASVMKPSYQSIKTQNPNDIGWANAVYLACLTCTTHNEYDWNVLGAKPAIMKDQRFFIGAAWHYVFYGQNSVYYNGRELKDVYVPEVGYCSTYNDILWAINVAGNNRNIYFSYR